MSEKEKPKRSTKMGILRSCLIFSLYPLLITGALGCGFVCWINGGYVKPWLDAPYIPTAEYLLEHPIEITEIEYPPYIALDTQQSFPQLCFTVISENDEDFDNLYLSEILINEQLLKPKFMFMEVLTSWPGAAIPCVYGFLFRGIHIIEFRLKRSESAEPYYIYRWAIEIP